MLDPMEVSEEDQQGCATGLIVGEVGSLPCGVGAPSLPVLRKPTAHS